MAASRQDISDWFDEGVSKGASHMIVVCDGWDYEDYPVFVAPEHDIQDVLPRYRTNMQTIMEVYNLSMDKAEQLAARRVWNV